MQAHPVNADNAWSWPIKIEHLGSRIPDPRILHTWSCRSNAYGSCPRFRVKLNRLSVKQPPAPSPWQGPPWTKFRIANLRPQKYIGAARQERYCEHDCSRTARHYKLGCNATHPAWLETAGFEHQPPMVQQPLFIIRLGVCYLHANLILKPIRHTWA